MDNYETLKTEYYEIYFQSKYKEDILKILDYSTDRLKKNLLFFNKDSYGEIIKASFFDNREDFINKIKNIDSNAEPPKWATGCFYGGEEQILLNKDNIMDRFLTLAHETCHLLFMKFIYCDYNDRVTWLDEAFAANFSGEVEREIESGEFIEIVKEYMNKGNLPKMSDISFENNNIKTDDYNGYDLFHIVGRYLVENNSKEDLLELFKNEEKILLIGDTILSDSLNYFVNKYSLK